MVSWESYQPKCELFRILTPFWIRTQKISKSMYIQFEIIKYTEYDA